MCQVEFRQLQLIHHSTNQTKACDLSQQCVEMDKLLQSGFNVIWNTIIVYLSYGDKGATHTVGLINFQHHDKEVLSNRTLPLLSPSPMLSVMIL